MNRAEETPDRARGHDGHSGSRSPRPGAPLRRRSWAWLGVALAAALVTVALVWFQPQKLAYSHRVSEPLPSVAAPPSEPSAPGPGTTAPAQPVQLASGDFVSREHHTEGTARVLRLP